MNQYKGKSPGVLRDLVLHIHMVDWEALPRIGSAADRGVKLSWRSNFTAANEEAPLLDDGYWLAVTLFSFTIIRLCGRNGRQKWVCFEIS